MKYYNDLFKLGIFTFSDALNIIGNLSNTKHEISNLIKKGYINRIKKSLYSVIDLSTLDDYNNRFVIASHITDDSFISYHSAFEFYACYNQVFYDVYVSSLKKFQSFSYSDYNYRYLETNSLTQVEVIQGVKVTSIERTIVDSINMLGKVMDVEELVKCVDLIHMLNEEKIKEILLEYNKDVLYRKVGYFLSFYKNEFNLSEFFFVFCLEHSNINNKGYISHNELNKLVYIKEWGIYAYKDIHQLVDKGGNIDV